MKSERGLIPNRSPNLRRAFARPENGVEETKLRCITLILIGRRLYRAFGMRSRASLAIGMRVVSEPFSNCGNRLLVSMHETGPATIREMFLFYQS